MRSLLLLLLFVPATALAGGHDYATRSTVRSYDTVGSLIDGFSVTSGFRWDRECPEGDAASILHIPRRATPVEPFFVGVEERLPLSSWADVGGNFDRDFTDAPHWSARAFVAFHPWRK